MAASLPHLKGGPLWGPVEAGVPAAAEHVGGLWVRRSPEPQASHHPVLGLWEPLTSGPHLPSQADTSGSEDRSRSEELVLGAQCSAPSTSGQFPDSGLAPG